MKSLNWQLLIIIPVILIFMFQIKTINSLFTKARGFNRFYRLFSSKNPLQKIYDILSPLNESHIRSIVSAPEESIHIKECIDSMENITLNDVGLSSSSLSRIKDCVCMNIYSCKKFHIAVFIIPTGCSLPLHDHPNVRYISSLNFNSSYR